MGIADRDYMRKRKVQWDEGRGEMRLSDDEPPDPPDPPSSRGWLTVLVTLVVFAGAVLWWYWNAKPPVPAAAVPPAAAQNAFEHPVPMVDSGNPVLVGRVTEVIDGDTIVVELSSGAMHVRFDSIDTPEKNQPWGPEARAALTRKLEHQQVTLDVVSQDRYERLVAVVGLNDENINAWLVRQGHAWAYRQYMKDPRYCTWESDARAAGRGLWSLPPAQRHAPWDFRARQRGQGRGFTDYSHETVESCMAAIHRKPVPIAEVATTAPTPLLSAPASGKCRIKGNISGSGKIYHVPGSDSYDRTRIDESKGERWFCTEEEAQAAGWRPRKR